MVVADDADAVDLDELTRQLQDDLLDTDVQWVVPVGAPAPAGAKGDEALVALAAAAIAGTVPAVLAMLTEWARARRCTVRLEGGDGSSIEMPGLTLEEAERIVAGWAEQRGGAG